MSYRFQHDEAPAVALRRVAREEVLAALAALADAALGQDEAIHQARKRCKKVRALLRLYRRRRDPLRALENVAFRDAARLLASARDAASVLESHDALLEHDTQAALDFAPIRRRLVRAGPAEDGALPLATRLARFAAAMCAALERIDGWTAGDEGFEAFAGGLARTYRRGKRAMRRADELCSAEAFHDWRKRVKDHWYHLRLLQDAAAAVAGAAEDAHALANLLGAHHDLAVLRARVAGREASDDDEIVRGYLAVVDRRRAELERCVASAGRRVYADGTRCLVRRLRRQWQARAGERTAQAAAAPRR